MNKNIKYLIKDIVNFNPIDYQDEESETISRDILDNMLLQVPKTKDKLIKLIQRRVRENKFGNKGMYYPDLSDIDVSNITDMSELFKIALSRISKPVKLDLRDWNMFNVTNMSEMFCRCKSLKELDLTGWDTSSITNMQDMFYGCMLLKYLYIFGWDTSKVYDNWY